MRLDTVPQALSARGGSTDCSDHRAQAEDTLHMQSGKLAEFYKEPMEGGSRETVEDDSIFRAIPTLGYEESRRELSREARESCFIKRNPKGARGHFVSQGHRTL